MPLAPARLLSIASRLPTPIRTLDHSSRLARRSKANSKHTSTLNPKTRTHNSTPRTRLNLYVFTPGSRWHSAATWVQLNLLLLVYRRKTCSAFGDTSRSQYRPLGSSEELVMHLNKSNLNVSNKRSKILLFSSLFILCLSSNTFRIAFLFVYRNSQPHRTITFKITSTKNIPSETFCIAP